MKKYIISAALAIILGIVLFIVFTWEEEGIRELNLEGLEVSYKNKIVNISDKFAIADDRIYFVKDNYDGGLYSMDLTGKGVVKLIDARLIDFKIDDKWIYFSNFDGLYKVKKDGSMQTRLVEGFIYKIQIIEDEIYYKIVKTKDLFSFESYNELYKVDIDGKSNVKVFDEMPADFAVVDDYIYYTLSSNPYSSPFMEIDVSRTNKQNKEQYKLYRMSFDGSNNVFITDIEDAYINYYDDIVFYFKDKGLYSMNTSDISKETKLMETIPFAIFVQGNSIYYTKDMHSIYELDIKSGEKKRLVRSFRRIHGLDVVGDWVFYQTFDKTLFGEFAETVRVVKKDGSQKQLLMKY